MTEDQKKDLLAQAKALNIEVDGRWSNETLEEKISEAQQPKGKGMFPVKLLKNYVPMDKYDVVGWHKPAVVRKDAGGRMVTVERAEFRTGEEAPPALAGTGYPGRVLAGTVIKLPIEEAKNVIAKHIAERADELPG